jgi:hypothetical protein
MNLLRNLTLPDSRASVQALRTKQINENPAESGWVFYLSEWWNRKMTHKMAVFGGGMH